MGRLADFRYHFAFNFFASQCVNVSQQRIWQRSPGFQLRGKSFKCLAWRHGLKHTSMGAAPARNACQQRSLYFLKGHLFKSYSRRWLLGGNSKFAPRMGCKPWRWTARHRGRGIRDSNGAGTVVFRAFGRGPRPARLPKSRSRGPQHPSGERGNLQRFQASALERG